MPASRPAGSCAVTRSARSAEEKPIGYTFRRPGRARSRDKDVKVAAYKVVGEQFYLYECECVNV